MFTDEFTRSRAAEVLDYIHKHPGAHDQGAFFAESSCGTTMCIAGTALFLEYGVDSNKAFDDHNFEDSYSYIAGPLLGLSTHNEIDWLFYEMDNELAIQKLKHLVVGDLPSQEEVDEAAADL